MNADVVLEPESLVTLRRYLDANRACGLVGPALAYPDGASQASAKRFPTLGLALTEILGVHTAGAAQPVGQTVLLRGS